MVDIKTVTFNSYEALTDIITAMYDELEKHIQYPEITIVSSGYKETCVLIDELMLCGFNLVSANINPPFMFNYDDEYYLEINWDGIFVSKCKDKNQEYIHNKSDILFISNDANSKILSNLEFGKSFAYEII